jgi:hypothetical protein
MRTAATAALLLAFVAAPCALEPRSEHTDSVERTFASGGTVRLDLSAGEYRLTGAAANRIRVVWTAADEDDLSDVKVRLDVDANDAAVRVSGSRSRFHAEVELPVRTDLRVRMTAGDLTISGIEGNKDVSLRAGDLVIDVGDPAQYRHVNASLWAGDLSARPFGFSTGGLFRSFKAEGAGPFELRARLWAGDLQLRRASHDR